MLVERRLNGLQYMWECAFVSSSAAAAAAAHHRLHLDGGCIMQVAYVLCHEKKNGMETDFPHRMTRFELVNM